MKRRELLALSAGSVATAMLPVTAFAATAMTDAYADRRVQQVITAHVQAFMTNIGIPPSNLRIGFPLRGMPRPDFGSVFPMSGAGVDWASGETRAEIDIGAMVQGMHDAMELPSGFGDLSSEQQAELLSMSQKLTEHLGNMGRTGIAPAALVVGGVLLSDLAAGAAILGVAVAVFGLGYSIGTDIGERLVESREIPSGECECPAEGGGSIMIPDIDGDGIPDDPMLPNDIFALAMSEAGMLNAQNANLRISISLEASDRGLSVTTSLRSDTRETTGQFILTA